MLHTLHEHLTAQVIDTQRWDFPMRLRSAHITSFGMHWTHQVLLRGTYSSRHSVPQSRAAQPMQDTPSIDLAIQTLQVIHGHDAPL